MTDDLHGMAPGHNAMSIPQFISFETDTGFFFDPPRTLGNFTEGQLTQLGDDSLGLEGKPSLEGEWDYWEDGSFHRYLSLTFCNGGYSGQVTIFVTTDTEDEYHTWNATLKLPVLSQIQRDPLTGWYENPKITWTSMEFVS